MRCGIVALTVILMMCASEATPSIITVSADYAYGGSPGGGVPIVDSSSDTGVLTVSSVGVVTDVNIAIDLTKSGSWIDGYGNPTGGGNTYNREIVLRLTSADGTTVNLVDEDTYSGESTSIRRTVTFDDSAATTVGGSAIVTGTFRPVGSLSDMIGESVSGDWTLYFADTVGSDPLSINNWTLEITTDTAVIPEPCTLIVWSLLGAIVIGVGWWRWSNGG